MKKIIIGLILIFLGVIGYFYFQMKSHSVKEENLITEKVKKGDLLIIVSAEGVIVPNRKVDIKSKIQGRIKSIFVDEGKEVNAQDIIAQIDPEEYQAKYDEAKANLQIAQVDLEKIKLAAEIEETQHRNKIENAEKTLQEAKLKLDEAEKKLLRTKQLKEKELISQSELDNAKTNYEIAKTHMENAQINLKSAKEHLDKTVKSNEQEVKLAAARVQQATAALKVAKENLNHTNIISPISGLITYKGVEIGDMVASETFGKASGTTIVTVSDLSSLFIETKINEVDIGMVKIGQDVTASVDAFPDYEIKGKVRKIALQAARSKGKEEEEGEISNFFVKIKILNPSTKLKPGMSCNIDIIVANLKDTLYIPVEAVIKEKKKQFVQVKSKDKILKREIKTGLSNPNFVQIISGVTEGEEIVIPMPEIKKKERWEE